MAEWSSYFSLLLAGSMMVAAFFSGQLMQNYWSYPLNTRSIGGATLDANFTLHIYASVKNKVTKQNITIGIEDAELKHCDGKLNVASEFCVKSKGRELMRLRRFQRGDGACYVIHREQQLGKESVVDCFNIGHAHWYGGFELVNQPWPLEKSSLELSPFVSTDCFTHKKQISGLTERYFLSSNGVGIHVEDDVPLYVSLDPSENGNLCLIAKGGSYPYIHHPKSPVSLDYTVCTGSNIRAVHSVMADMYIDHPMDIPDTRMFRYPVWSTWAQYNKDIDQAKVLEFAAQISKHGLENSQIEIDDDWTPFYGDHDFNLTKFPDSGHMIKTLTNQGYRVTTWLHPFMNPDSKAFQEASREGYVVMSPDRSKPAITKWWHDEAAMLDVTNPKAVDWFLAKLEYLRSKYNVSSFKFDAGEASFYPTSYSIKNTFMNPDNYARLWTDLAFRSDPDVRHQEVRAGWRSQKYPIFVRLFDRMSSWGYDTGLKTVIPAVLTFGLLGYPFVLPDMIGGNAYADMISFDGGAYPERELYIRWIQVNTFLPAVQFSIGPWIYDQEVIAIAKSQMKLREKYADKIIALARESVNTGHPIIRPLWWIAPEDTAALTTDSQFLLGDDLLVAPVLEKGARERDIYIPIGRWRDELKGDVVTGPVWLRNHPVGLDELPHFVRQ